MVRTARGWALDAGWSIGIAQEQIPVWSAYPELDPAWKYTDAAGHEHMAVDRKYPTLVRVPSMVWCIDHEEEEDHGHYECPLCGEHIVRGTVSIPFSRTIPGMTTITVTTPEDESFTISEEDYDAIIRGGMTALTVIMERDGLRRSTVYHRP